MDGDIVPREGLFKALKRAKIPTSVPLVVEIPANTSMDTKMKLAGQLASVGYRPVFKAPRHVITSVGSSGSSAPLKSGPATPGRMPPPP